MLNAHSIKRPLQALAALALAALAFVTFGQEKYPSRPVEFIVPWGPGGGADQLARKAGKLMEEDL
jgi:tripartite-type tricarboxylate transporter receptor subunit TctC